MLLRRIVGAARFALGLGAAMPVAAQVDPALANHELQRQEQRDRARQKQDEAKPDVRLQPEKRATQAGWPENESPCFPIRRVVLEGDLAGDFAWALKAADGVLGRCLGSAGINVLVGEVQNALVAKGFVTARVLAAPQDLLGGELHLKLVPGRVRALNFPEQQPAFGNALPLAPGDLLNLRDIEQGLENLKRVPGAQADIEIEPGEKPGESDLRVNWRGGRAYRASVSLDDSGSQSTGTYQGGLTLSADNPLGLQDLFYLTLNRNLPGDSPGGDYGTHGHAIHYSVPYHYWLLSLQLNDFRYRQTVAGAFQDYLYSGTSATAEIKVSRLVYRDASRKTTLSLRTYRRASRNYIDDTEVEVQHRRMGGFVAGIAHKEFIGRATLDGNLTWKVGTSAFGSLPAPEEAYGEGTARPRIANADITLNLPLSRSLSYQATWRRQWNRTRLIPQDRFAIGGRYTVRGFDGEASLAAERGWLLRNDLTWNLPAAQQLYLAFDHGVVSGPSAPLLAGTRLSGAGIGWRGQFGGLSADFFAGRPVNKPADFRTTGTATGFTLNYEF
jgi:hemolysin activation/secretion protein